MNKREAELIAKQLQASFDVYFKNRYTVHSGKHWQKRPQDSHQTLAQRSITTNCCVTRSTDKPVGTFAFRFVVTSGEPKFVEASFRVPQIMKEIETFFVGRLKRIENEAIDFRRKQLFLSYQDADTKHYIFFNFQAK